MFNVFSAFTFLSAAFLRVFIEAFMLGWELLDVRGNPLAEQFFNVLYIAAESRDYFLFLVFLFFSTLKFFPSQYYFPLSVDLFFVTLHFKH